MPAIASKTRTITSTGRQPATPEVYATASYDCHKSRRRGWQVVKIWPTPTGEAAKGLEAAVVAWWRDQGATFATRDEVPAGDGFTECVSIGVVDIPTTIARVEELRAALGWEVKVEPGRKPSVDESRRPPVPKGINDLLGVEESSSGQTTWSYLSAVSHVTWYGVRSTLSHTPGGAASTGPTLVDASTQSFRVQLWAPYVLRGLRAAAEARFLLMGWADDDLWRDTCREADTFAIVTMPQVLTALDGVRAAEELPPAGA